MEAAVWQKAWPERRTQISRLVSTFNSLIGIQHNPNFPMSESSRDAVSHELTQTIGPTYKELTEEKWSADLRSSGWNQSETDLTPSTVASSNFGQLTTLQVDGNVFAQPLLVSGFTMPDGTTHDVLVVATGHDSVYAFDAQSYAAYLKSMLMTTKRSQPSTRDHFRMQWEKLLMDRTRRR